MTHPYTKLADAIQRHANEETFHADQIYDDLSEAARILRAAASVDVAGLMELAAKAIYDQWADQLGWVEWVPGGNSLNQDEARSIARAALESALRMALAGREEWQPIETAPAEGRFLCVGNGVLRIGRRYNGSMRDDRTWQVMTRPAMTHWMPLPAAPKGTP